MPVTCPFPTRRFLRLALRPWAPVHAAAALLLAIPTSAGADNGLTMSGSVTVPTMALAAAALIVAACVIGVWLWRNSLNAAFRRERTDLEQRLADRERSEQALMRIREELEAQVGETTRERNEALRDLASTRRALENQVSRTEDLARIDDLTGLANRARFDEALDDEIKRMVRERKALSMLLCEIDYLDAFIDADGDERGNATQRKVAQAIETTFRRAGDLVARLDDRRVAVILPATDKEAALRFAERLRHNVWDLCIPFDGSETADRVTASVGVATAEPDRLHKPGDILAAAERSLFTATENGRNRYGPAALVMK